MFQKLLSKITIFQYIISSLVKVRSFKYYYQSICHLKKIYLNLNYNCEIALVSFSVNCGMSKPSILSTICPLIIKK